MIEKLQAGIPGHASFKISNFVVLLVSVRSTAKAIEKMISELMDVLSGRSEHVVRRLHYDMTTASDKLHFERAATIRDQLNAIEFITKSHVAVSPKMTNQDVIALARDKNDAVVQILFIRNGKLIGSDTRQLDNTADETDSTVLQNFITQFYGGRRNVTDIPRELVFAT